ncbi:MAG TPA: IPT/TIG domain-containing protein [Polyangia bacterium]
MIGGPPKNGRSYPVEDFLSALTAQLDRAQDALALKVSGTNRPLTWALKDLTIDLRVFIEVNDSGKVLLRSAGPNEDGASTVHLSLTTITRPMVEENSYSYQADEDPRTIDAIAPSAKLDEQDQRRLEWMGVRTVGQLKQLDPTQVQAVIGIPADRLMAALEQASRPSVVSHRISRDSEGQSLLTVRGANLSDGSTPEVRINGQAIEVVTASPQQLVLRPDAYHTDGQLEVFANGQRATSFVRLGRPPVAVPATATGNGKLEVPS